MDNICKKKYALKFMIPARGFGTDYGKKMIITDLFRVFNLILSFLPWNWAHR